MDLGERIKQERERLDFSQTAFAALAGASKHSQINWEKGTSVPNTDVLIAWKASGADIRFITEGIYAFQEIGSRLRSERTRLNKNVQGMAELGCISVEQQRRYEEGLERPSADYLNLIAKADAETWFILTGELPPDDIRHMKLERDLLRAAMTEIQAWQVREQRFLPPEKFAETVLVLAELAEGDPARVKPAAAKALRLVA